jgi:polysaccharide deacetylase family protein (PEP-CTERM system associated)
MRNALTIDVEDYFQVTAFERYLPRSDWERIPLRVGENTRRLLGILDEYGIKATFFVLGWVAQRDPGLVREIHSRGHEIACHGYGHELIYRIGPERFREDVRRAKALLEELVGIAVSGYRAPSYSITLKSLWALEILAEEGFCYDSSIFPVHHDTYGMPGAPRFPYSHTLAAGVLREFPLTTLPLAFARWRYNLPIAGGGYLRLLPAELIRRGIGRINGEEKKPAVLYLHPWEIDPGQPRIKAGWKSSFRHYNNLDRTEAKLRHLLDHLQFGTMTEVLGALPVS